ncbi:MAG TPA: VOC family protein [Anaerolineae bacterium]|jgi:predicted 3-demethylubiquinone-9 3-methyltransferase (glyoxalase superfamily)
MQKITPFLWFDGVAGEAAEFYVSIFKNARITHTDYYPEGAPMPAGTVITVRFEIEEMEFVALNAGPEFHFTPAISFFVDCHSQQEVDELWSKLSAGGAEGQCGWLTDKYGISWQIVPSILGEYLGDKDPVKAQRVMQAMLQMHKLDIQALRDAYVQGDHAPASKNTQS